MLTVTHRISSIVVGQFTLERAMLKNIVMPCVILVSDDSVRLDPGQPTVIEISHDAKMK